MQVNTVEFKNCCQVEGCPFTWSLTPCVLPAVTSSDQQVKAGEQCTLQSRRGESSTMRFPDRP